MINDIPILKIVPMPSDANINGNVFGGWIMSQIDIAGSIIARKEASGKVATVAVNSIHFKKPIFIGDVTSFYASVTKTGKTSVTVYVEVYSNRDNISNDIKVADATLTYVAIDGNNCSRNLTSRS